MRGDFPEWYAPTEEELRRSWNQGLVVLDSNVLLDLYHYPPTALDEFFTLLERLQERLWLPHRAALEYQRNRDKSFPQPREILEQLTKRIDELAGKLDRLGLPEYHPVLDLAVTEHRRLDVRGAFNRLLEPIRSALERTPVADPSVVLGSEPIRDRLTSLFAGRVGKAFTAAETDAYHVEASDRYLREIPPGYKDIKKPEPERYGDYILWKQILTHARVRNGDARDVIFVTNDRKEDWWLRKEDSVIGPRPELVREYLETVGGSFRMYTPARFVQAAPTFVRLTVSTETIEEIGRVSASSPVTTVLRYQRMVLPDPASRVHALGVLYDALARGRIKTVADLQAVIEGLGEPFSSNYVEAPLFFSLIKPTYGPVQVPDDADRRLRERPCSLRNPTSTKDEFVATAHVAWIAQALYRVRLERYSDEDLLVAFFGEDYSRDAPSLLTQAKALAASDQQYGGYPGAT